MISIVGTVKLRTEPLVLLRQSDGETFWLPLADLANNALCINSHHLPSLFTHADSRCHLFPSTVPVQPSVLVDSPEPTDLLIQISSAPRYNMQYCSLPSPQLLLITGVAGAGKSTLISALQLSMSERLVFPTITCTSPLAWVGQHNKSHVLSPEEFFEQEKAGAFVYVAALPSQKGVRWGLLRQDVLSASAPLPATSLCGGPVLPSEKAFFAVVEEHPAGVLAAREAGVKCLVLHVTVPTIDIMDQRLRMSSKCYEEEQVSFAVSSR